MFDQSAFVRTAIDTLVHEGAIGLVLTALMILIFLGSMRATAAVFLSIPLSALAAFIALNIGGSSINAMILGGLALAFSRLIDNSVIVLENIFRHMEMRRKRPRLAAERGGQEVALPVLAATLTTVVVFFPVTFLYGVSKFLFTALARSVVISLFASYFVAMSVVPLFCAKLIKTVHGHDMEHEPGPEAGQKPKNIFARFNLWFNKKFAGMLDGYEKSPGARAFTAAAGDGHWHQWRFYFEPCIVSFDWARLFSAHRSGPVCDHDEGSLGHATRSH